jgi:hypothetical protein
LDALPLGQYVKHYRYGYGVITESNDEGTCIEFELHGVKKFVTSLMVVELSDLTPPKRFRAKWVKSAPAPRTSRRASARNTIPAVPDVTAASEVRGAGRFFAPPGSGKTTTAPRLTKRRNNAGHLDQ